MESIIAKSSKGRWSQTLAPNLFDLIDELRYTAWIGCAYGPRGDTVAGLGWACLYDIGLTTDSQDQSP